MSLDKGPGPSPGPQPQPENPMGFSERRRLGRELHHSTAGLIDAIGLALDRLAKTDEPHFAGLIKECEEAIREISARITALANGDDS